MVGVRGKGEVDVCGMRVWELDITGGGAWEGQGNESVYIYVLLPPRLCLWYALTQVRARHAV